MRAARPVAMHHVVAQGRAMTCVVRQYRANLVIRAAHDQAGERVVHRPRFVLAELRLAVARHAAVIVKPNIKIEGFDDFLKAKAQQDFEKFESGMGFEVNE